MKATKLPSGKYMATAFLGKDEDGKQVRKSFTAQTARKAIALAVEYENNHKIISDQSSLKTAMRRFLEEKEHALSPSTARDYASRCKTLCSAYPAFCAKHIQTITTHDLDALVRDMRTTKPPHHRLNKEPKAMSPKTIKNYMIFLQSVFRHAGVTLPPVELPKRPAPTLYIPTDAEIKSLIAAAEGTAMYVPILLAAFGPLRRGEICALEYPRDFSGNIIHVMESQAYDADDNIRRKAPKTPTSDRFIEMPGFVIDAIREQGYVTKLTPRLITSRFPHVLKRAGLPRFRFHDLRHYCVSTLHAQGVATASIVARCGHASDQMVQRVYRHILADQDAIQTAKAMAHFESVFSPN